ncbi:MAG: thiamine ABC transporter ATP-binding protein [bacterium]
MMLEVENLRFDYPEASVRAEFRLGAGRAAALMGASGAGKSTVLHLIAGFLAPTRGAVRFNGRSLLGVAPAARPLTYLLQAHNLFPHLTVRQNIAIGLHPGLRLAPTQRDAVERALEWVALQSYAARLPHQLSGGQQQRVALARCLARDRPLLLLDEPFTGLDDALRDEMLSLLRALQTERGTAILLATHQHRDADALSAKVVALSASEKQPA